MTPTILEDKIERERNRVRRQIEALRHLLDERFGVGESVLLGNDCLPVWISAGVDPTRPRRHFVAFGSSGQPPAIAQDLACGIVRTDTDGLVAAKRTNVLGRFVVDLPDDKCRYTLRPVLEVRELLDVLILEQLGDPAAAAQLEAAILSETLSAEVQAAAQRVLDRGANPSGGTVSPAVAFTEAILEVNTGVLASGGMVSPAVGSTGHTLRRVPESLASAANDAGAPGRQPMSEDACGYWVDSGRLRFRLPEEGRFPFSAVWIEVHERDCVVASRLLPVTLDPNSNCYRNSLPVTELLGNRTFTSNLQIHYWSDEAWIVEKVPLEEVDRVLETSYVRNRPDVKHGLERLRQRIEEHGSTE